MKKNKLRKLLAAAVNKAFDTEQLLAKEVADNAKLKDDLAAMQVALDTQWTPVVDETIACATGDGDELEVSASGAWVKMVAHGTNFKFGPDRRICRKA